MDPLMSLRATILPSVRAALPCANMGNRLTAGVQTWRTARSRVAEMEGIDLDAGSYGSAPGFLRRGRARDRDCQPVSRKVWPPGLCPARDRAQSPRGRGTRTQRSRVRRIAG